MKLVGEAQQLAELPTLRSTDPDREASADEITLALLLCHSREPGQPQPLFACITG